MHTPTPWVVSGLSKTTVFSGEKIVCATVLYGKSKQPRQVNIANAAFIVRACNAHDDLIAACKAIDDATLYDGDFCFDNIDFSKLGPAIDLVVAAIKKAAGAS